MLSIILVGFWLAILFQIIYYLYFHPAHDISLCVRVQDKFHFIHVNRLSSSGSSLTITAESQQQQQQVCCDNLVKDDKQDIVEKKFEYKLFHVENGDDDDEARSFKSTANIIYSMGSIASMISSSKSSLYHSISNRKQAASLYGSCVTLKDDETMYNPLFSTAAATTTNEDECSLILKRQQNIEMLKIKETSL